MSGNDIKKYYEIENDVQMPDSHKHKDTEDTPYEHTDKTVILRKTVGNNGVCCTEVLTAE